MGSLIPLNHSSQRRMLRTNLGSPSLQFALKPSLFFPKPITLVLEFSLYPAPQSIRFLPSDEFDPKKGS
jgi:hypothetical protein